MRTAISALLVCVSLVVSAQAGENLLKNPGFETLAADGKTPADWSIYTEKGGAARLSEPGRSGKYALELVADSDKAAENNVLVTSAPLPAVGRRTFVLKGFMRAAGAAQGFASFAVLDAQGKPLAHDNEHSAVLRNLPQWTPFRHEFTTLPAARSLRIILRNTNTPGKGSVGFDDLSLEVKGGMLDNEQVSISLDPLGGGRITSFLLKATGEEKTVWKGGFRHGGLAAEVVPAERVPGLLMDVAHSMETLEADRRVRLTHESKNPAAAGLRFEKEYALVGNSAAIDVLLRVRNLSQEPKKTTLRVQQCLAPARHLFTWPCAGEVRLFDRANDVILTQLWIEKLSEGWIASVHAPSKSGLVATFDLAKVEKAYGYFGDELDTIEWWYKEIELPAGGSWETTYTLSAIAGSAPVVSASRELAVGLAPAQLGRAEGYAWTLYPLRTAAKAELALKAVTAGGRELLASPKVALKNGEAATTPPEWKGEDVRQISIRSTANGLTQETLLSTAARDIKAEKVTGRFQEFKDLGRYPETTACFPFGVYVNRYAQYKESGPEEAAWARILDDCRRRYLNTVMSGLATHKNYIGSVDTEKRCWIGDAVRARGMKLIPILSEVVRTYTRQPDGSRVETFPETVTRDEVLNERLGKSPFFSLDTMKNFARLYNDILLAYEVADEPQPQHIPAYTAVREIMRDINPDRPAMPILNLSQSAYIPHVPIYFGDLYPIRSHGVLDRNPWNAGETTRSITTRTRTPVWVMLQAFSTDPRLTNFKNPYTMPDEAETRYMIYSVVANGGKGIMYHGAVWGPAWRYKSAYDRVLVDCWGGHTAGWNAVGAAAQRLTAIGPALLESDFEVNDKFTVEAPAIETRNGYYKGPAVGVGVLKQRTGGGHFLVAQNQDVTKPQRGALAVMPEMAQGKALYDLFADSLEAVPATTKLTLDLIPGDARILYCGPEKEARRVIDVVLTGRCANERAIFDIDLSRAEKNGIDVAPAVAAAKQSAEALAAKDAPKAYGALLRARKLLLEATRAAPALGACVERIQDAQRRLAAITTVFGDHIATVIPNDLFDATKNGAQYGKQADERMQQYLDATAGAYAKLLALTDRVNAGEAKAVVDELVALDETVQQLEKNAIPYVTEKARATAK
jgi:hypothetical protein